MTTASKVREILERTRELFATTHWTTGNFHTYSGGGNDFKHLFCAVGGLRYIAAGNDAVAAENDWSLGEYDAYDEYIEARALVLAIMGDLEECDYTREEVLEGPVDEYRTRDMLEGIIINWNDSFSADDPDDKAESLVGVLASFDAALASVVV